MTHPALRSFFSGAVDALRAAYVQSASSSSASAGSLREGRLRKVFEQTLPPSITIQHGDVIDPYENSTGQLDGILVHPLGTALKVDSEDPGIVLAESAIAVLESKSNLASQWDQVREKAAKVASVRRFDPLNPKQTVTFGPPRRGAHLIPLHIVGHLGWQKPETLMEKTLELFHLYPAPQPTIVVVQLTPPGVGYVDWVGQEYKGGATVVSEEYRWDPLLRLWAHLTAASQAVLMQPVDWERYVRYAQPLDAPAPDGSGEQASEDNAG